MKQKLDWTEIDAIIDRALTEDIGSGDVTSLAMQIDLSANAEIISKQKGVLSGIEVAKRVFTLHDAGLNVQCLKHDGDLLQEGDVILKIMGAGESILTAERTALNLIGRMSGIATLTEEFVKKTKGTKCRILDTRKTMPNLRLLDKYAVTCGGGDNHRIGLYDMILIKENHIRWAGGLEKALEAALDFAKPRKLEIEIEVNDLYEYERAAKYPIKMIMLDHFTLSELREAVSIEHRNILLEASGDINLNTIENIAKTGIDVVSIGALTHSAPNYDFSLLFHETK
ncbi:MAG: carboxylating nicotinate-nucleotide diphosphorylase [Candidatus Marinimicrobia bacterium]|nr:carboxylating nicotinate-nucleotide diphosphorylase [Candidatus Neomarinimicrobiota bacterium]